MTDMWMWVSNQAMDTDLQCHLKKAELFTRNMFMKGRPTSFQIVWIWCVWWLMSSTMPIQFIFPLSTLIWDGIFRFLIDWTHHIQKIDHEQGKDGWKRQASLRTRLGTCDIEQHACGVSHRIQHRCHLSAMCFVIMQSHTEHWCGQCHCHTRYSACTYSMARW